MSFELINCTICSKRLRADNTHTPLCRKCWEKTGEGREYLKLKQRESRKNRNFSAATALKCMSCSSSIHKDGLHSPLCRKCWEKTPEGQEYKNELNKESKKKSRGILKGVREELGADIPIYHICKRISDII